MRVVFRTNDYINVFTIKTSMNAKITNSNKAIVQTFAFSKDQFESVVKKEGVIAFLDGDAAVCGDCPYSKNSGYVLGKCYTHKYRQLKGFNSILRAIANDCGGLWENIPTMPDNPPESFLVACYDKYIRFGTYGETVLIPINWMKAMVSVCKNWTGYTHQWMKCDSKYNQYLMASVHSVFEQAIANDKGWLTFLIYKEDEGATNVLCPANREDVTCQKCSLCSGTIGKGSKNIKIKYH
jgi:hypothetical protein